MRFMQKQVTDRQTWIEIDGTDGITAVPADIAGDVLVAVKLGNNGRAEELALEFYSGSQVFEVTAREGFGARMSAPGFLDCTEWSVFHTEAEAQQYLSETYGDDEEETEDGEE
jgi:hypothetical protein